eukprot:GHUV01045027.1.p1 GENE.GHUV01045027.1~~GHUV01045027.1.p1  ORF type:complete len:105 (-),score=18.95 GHUV01045027.1:96-410(-)
MTDAACVQSHCGRCGITQTTRALPWSSAVCRHIRAGTVTHRTTPDMQNCYNTDSIHVVAGLLLLAGPVSHAHALLVTTLLCIDNAASTHFHGVLTSPKAHCRRK